VLRSGRQNQTSRAPVVWYSVRVPSLRTLTAVLLALIQEPKVEHQHKYQPMDIIMNHFHPTPNLSRSYNLILFSWFLHQNSLSTPCLHHVTHTPTHRSTVTSIILSTVTRFNNHVFLSFGRLLTFYLSATQQITRFAVLPAPGPHIQLLRVISGL
jgi:hypothetical protein